MIQKCKRCGEKVYFPPHSEAAHNGWNRAVPSQLFCRPAIWRPRTISLWTWLSLPNTNATNSHWYPGLSKRDVRGWYLRAAHFQNRHLPLDFQNRHLPLDSPHNNKIWLIWHTRKYIIINIDPGSSQKRMYVCCGGTACLTLVATRLTRWPCLAIYKSLYERQPLTCAADYIKYRMDYGLQGTRVLGYILWVELATLP